LFFVSSILTKNQEPLHFLLYFFSGTLVNNNARFFDEACHHSLYILADRLLLYAALSLNRKQASVGWPNAWAQPPPKVPVAKRAALWAVGCSLLLAQLLFFENLLITPSFFSFLLCFGRLFIKPLFHFAANILAMSSYLLNNKSSIHEVNHKSIHLACHYFSRIRIYIIYVKHHIYRLAVCNVIEIVFCIENS
jgi:hypothetical protein